MHQQNPLRVGISASLRAAGLIIGTAIFVGACAGESDSTNEQTGSNQVNQQTAPPQANAARRAGNELLRGVAAKGDWTTDAPGVRRKLTPADLPAPYATDSVFNQPNEISQPQGAMPQVPAGFRVEKFADRLKNPRMIRIAPNGDLFVTESEVGRIRLLRDANSDGTPEISEVFASGLDQPFGIAFYPVGANPHYVYVANTGSIVRFPYQKGDTTARGKSETIVSGISGGGLLEGGGHWTRASSSRRTDRNCMSRSDRARMSRTANRKRAARGSSRTRPRARTSAFMPTASAIPSDWRFIL